MKKPVRPLSSVLPSNPPLRYRLAVNWHEDAGWTRRFTRSSVAIHKTYVTNRYNFLMNHAELRPLQPKIVAVHNPSPQPGHPDIPSITADVQPNGADGIDSVEEILLIDTDANLNAVLDSVIFGAQQADQSNGRSPNGSGTLIPMQPTPGLQNASP
jgi:hypothetical protein